ncbi:hypothetical protein YC2023_040625 [Brassica napus]
MVSDLLALLRVERDKIGAATYDGCLRTLVEGIKPFVVRLGVKVLMTCFPAKPLRSSFHVAVIRRVDADGILYGCRRKITSCHLSAVGSRLIRLVWLEPSISPRTIFKPPGSADQKFWVSFITLLSLCRMYESHLHEMAKSV